MFVRNTIGLTMPIKPLEFTVLSFCLAISFQHIGGYSQISENSETMRVVIHDISSAFGPVAANASVVEELIPEMYDLNASRSAAFVFKIPRKDGRATISTMQRSDFLEPNFPNLTTSYMKLMKERRKLMAKSPSWGNNNRQEDDWSELGLMGWTGEISKPAPQFNRMHGQKYDDVYQANDELYRDTKLKQIVTSFVPDAIDLSAGRRPHSEKLLAEQTVVVGDNDNNKEDNVYIARVNDPFGYSTNWELRNSTKLEYVFGYTPKVREERMKRDVIKLYSMIKCSTGCDPLVFKGYGCYCGFLGAGVPVDGIDRCCKLHDKCYENSNCISYLEYFVPYIWKCYRGKPLCAIDHGEWGGPRSCAARLCQCDMRLSRCLRKFACPRSRATCRTSAARKLQNLLFF